MEDLPKDPKIAELPNATNIIISVFKRNRSS